MRESSAAEDLLSWYDVHARTLPWRVSPEDRKAGVLPDPYRVWLSEIMLQQTTVAAVKAYFEKFTTLWPDVDALADADDSRVLGEWAGLGYYARARNLVKCSRTVSGDLGGVFPTDREGLLELPGIGPYTASAIAAIAHDRPETVVDGNVERVMARLHDVAEPLPGAKPTLTSHAAALTPGHRPGDYAQAVMDLGATICTPKKPACGLCPWVSRCQARLEGREAELPRKTPKTAKPVRRGSIYVARRSDGAYLLERRPDSGLLGGMLAWPGGVWGEALLENAPMDAKWRKLGAEVRHTFTHFHLRLDVYVADVTVDAIPERGTFVDRADFRPADLPTVMRKVYDLASAPVGPN